MECMDDKSWSPGRIMCSPLKKTIKSKKAFHSMIMTTFGVLLGVTTDRITFIRTFIFMSCLPTINIKCHSCPRDREYVSCPALKIQDKKRKGQILPTPACMN